jgi:hypothetical protein
VGSALVPGADRSRFYGNRYGGLIMPRLDKIVLHTTETSGAWPPPGYSAGAAAPNMTINPWPGHQGRWQHYENNRAARALLNPESTAVSENQDNVWQVEIVGYSDKHIADTYGYWLPELPQAGIEYIAETLAWLINDWNISDEFTANWKPYPASWGPNNGVRFSSAQFDAFRGICGHQHVSGNDHGDPYLDIEALKAAVWRRTRHQEWDEMATQEQFEASILKVLKSAEGRKAVFDAVLHSDAVAAPTRSIQKDSAGKPVEGSNLNWQLESYVRFLDAQLDAVRNDLAKLTAALPVQAATKNEGA